MPTLLSAPLPDVDLRAASLITVDAGDPNAVITRLIIHVSQDAPELPRPVPSLPPVVTYGDEAPGLTR